ncbi:uncharacterized protein AC631_03087 [Debaryomyces fabryi]|uniref:HTH APSES-type domain-containing protein n=1 Tax=Debaryomyces fabryi TaxID=58627 RepID=A0A0V1PYG9_9ASCO|nr:uncharacterized protein AC631_03087 [Debaryomyces fabryi]KSA01146.1 hypothetical protein AC631_03087 [Debaryomyces fabryi]CUM46376.1 unnamed protein product [Debaryomyces fabryi]
MIPFNTPRQFSYDSYQPSYAQYFPTNPPNDENGGNKDSIRYHETNTMNNANMNNGLRINYRSNSEFGMNFAPIAYTPERNGFGPTIGKHKKSKSLPKTQFPLINKFQNRLNKTPTKTHGNSEVHMSNKVNFPVHQLSLDIPLENIASVQSIYPQIETKKYSTSAIDPLRIYVTVFEYSINSHWIIWDYETGFVHLTGIWKASINDEVNTHRNLKADIVKLLESTPKQYHQHIKRIRGGFLKIQGTWLPFDLCKMLAKRFCYHIRFQLIPIFGNTFPLECLTPDDKGFGELKLDEYMNGSVVESRQGKKTHKVVKRQSNSLLESPVIKRASSASYLPMPMTNQFLNPNSIPIYNTPQRLPQFTFPQTTGLYSQPYQYQENTPQYALSSLTHNSNSSSLSIPQSQAATVPSTQSLSLHTPYQTTMHILPNSQLSSALYHSPHSLAHTAENTFHTPNQMPQHSFRTPSHTNLIAENLAEHTPSSDMSYHDMIDLVNASKCLQSLSQTQISPISHEPLSNRDYVASIPKSPTSNGNGISSILLAAGVSEDRPQPSNHSRRISMKINDILS